MLTDACNAIVGGAAQADGTYRDGVVTIVGSRGNFCTGAVIAPDLILSAAHCVQRGAVHKVVLYGGAEPQLLNIKRIAQHPLFNAQAILNSRASADVALLQLDVPLTGKAPQRLGVPSTLTPGNAFTIAGVGVGTRGDGKTGGAVRNATLNATGKPSNLQIRLVDPATDNGRNGLGACTGDSGAPVFEMQAQRPVIIGVVSWSTAANNAAGCGGLTGVTPLTLYRDWILKTARVWGAQI